LSVAAQQRWGRGRECPICGGHQSLDHGLGIRCAGYLSSDGRYARCSREDRAGDLSMARDGLFAHRLGDWCNCGLDHTGIRREPVERAPAPTGAGHPPRTIPANELPSVYDWLRKTRGISGEEISKMRALMTYNHGPAVAFPYLRRDRSVQAIKVRSIAKKSGMFTAPAGAGSLHLYGWDMLQGGATAVVVEGELDVHSLWSVGVRNTVSVPHGARGILHNALLAPLGPYSDVAIAVDNDSEGNYLASRLTAALGEGRCRRVLFSGHKDANEALVAGWTREQFTAALALGRAL
jgi:5S rRNA maturation endonuclease (ribonuclease M5)